MRVLPLWFVVTAAVLAAPADDFVITVKTDNPGASNDDQFTIPIVTTYGSGYSVDCDNDGTNEVTGATTVDYPNGYTCTYPSSGTYTIRVKDNNGDKKGFTRIRFYINSTTQTDALKLIRLEQWGTAKWSSMVQAYRGAANLTSTPSDIPNLSSVKSLQQTFYGCSAADINTTGWDISHITNLSETFRGASSANPDVSDWNTSSVTNMTGTFQDAVQAKPDTSRWDTSNVSKMNNLFRGAIQANPDTSGWDTSKVTTMYAMFYEAANARPSTKNWNTSQVTTMAYMFQDASAADPDTSNWNTSKVTTMRAMFKNAVNANPVTSTWNTSSVTKMVSMFENAQKANPDVHGWDTSAVTSMQSMFKDASRANPDVSDWNVSAVTTMSDMFQNAVAFDRDLSRWDVSSVSKFINFLSGAKLSTYHYDALLKSWSQMNLISGVKFYAGNSTYCQGEQARDDIISNNSWIFYDAGKHCPGPCEEVHRPLRAYHWTLVSFPCDTGSNGIEALLGGALGTYGGSADWVMYEQTGSDDYIGHPNTQKRMLDAGDGVQPGKGYWIIVAQDADMSVDTNLSGLAFTAEINASDLGISDPDFNEVNRSTLPDTDATKIKKVMKGNPFPKTFELSNLYFSHGGGSYRPMGNSANDPYIRQSVYTFDANSTSSNDYTPIAPQTPGFAHRIDPMTGFFTLLEANASGGGNDLAFPDPK